MNGETSEEKVPELFDGFQQTLLTVQLETGVVEEPRVRHTGTPQAIFQAERSQKALETQKDNITQAFWSQ